MISKQEKKKMNPMLMKVLLISLGVHLLAGFILGSWIVVKYAIPDDAQFEEPPAIKEEAPPPEVKVEIKPPPPPQNKAMQNLRLKQVGNIAVAAVDVDLPSMDDSFTVSGGLGSVGGGSLLGGAAGKIGLGLSDVSVFGLKTKAERILFIIDVDRSMLTDQKGGLDSFKVIKNEITDMVGNLSPGTLFNVVLADGGRVKLFNEKLVSSGTKVHADLVKWIAPVNTNSEKPGLEGDSSAQNASLTALPSSLVTQNLGAYNVRKNHNAIILQFALEQNVDAIFFITGYHRGFEELRRRLTEEEQAKWDREISRPQYQQQLAEHRAEVPEMRRRISEELARINQQRRERNQPARVLFHQNNVIAQARELDLRWETPHPGIETPYFISERDMEKHFKDLLKTLYDDKGVKTPSVNVVLFLAKDETHKKEWETALNRYVRLFGGKNRIIRGLEGIRSARSAQTTEN